VSLDALGSLALQVTFDVMGVPAILTRPDATVVSTSVIWLEPILIDVPSSTDLQRRELRRVAALSRTDVSRACLAARGLTRLSATAD
jgi:hypothetical protein